MFIDARLQQRRNHGLALIAGLLEGGHLIIKSRGRSGIDPAQNQTGDHERRDTQRSLGNNGQRPMPERYSYHCPSSKRLRSIFDSTLSSFSEESCPRAKAAHLLSGKSYVNRLKAEYAAMGSFRRS